MLGHLPGCSENQKPHPPNVDEVVDVSNSVKDSFWLSIVSI
jgi:hypothetical protein